MNRNILYLGLVSFFTDFATAMINPILPIFVVYYLDASVEKLGFIVALATFVSYIFRIISGYVSDRLGIVKPIVVAGYALSAFSKPLLGFADSWQSVAALRALERFGKAVRSAPKDALISAYAVKVGRGFGLHKTLDIAGELGGSLLLFFVLHQISQSEETIRLLFFATLVPGLIALVILVFLVQDAPSKKRGAFRLTSHDKRAATTLLFYFAFLFFFFSDSYFAVAAKEVGVDTANIALLFILSTATQTMTSYIGGVAYDKYGYKTLLLAGFIAGITALAALHLAHPYIAFIFLGLFSVFTLNANRAYIAQKAHNKATLYGIFYAGVALFASLGALVIGWLWHHYGMERTLWVAIAGCSIVTIVFFIGYKDAPSQ